MMRMKSGELHDWLVKLRESGKAIIVEGPKDRAALEHFAVPVTAVLSEQPLFAVAERIAASHRDAVILTDLDAEGRKLYAKLVPILQRLGVRIDGSFREFLFRETELAHIEGLVTYAARQGE